MLKQYVCMKIYIGIIFVIIFIVAFFLFLKSNKAFKDIKLDLGLGAIIFGAMIAIYSLILAFVVIVVWQQYQVTGDRIETEASKLYNVYRSTYAFKDSSNSIIAASMRTGIKSYIRSVQDDEWPSMEFDSSSQKTQKINNDLRRLINQIEPVTEGEKIWYASAIHDMNQFSEARHFRLSDRDYCIPQVMWLMLIAGAAVIILFSMFLESNNTHHHLMKVLMISVMIISSLLLVYMLDHPFKGALRLKSTAFEKIFVGNW